MTVEQIRTVILPLTKEYSLSRVTLFGSRAAHTNEPDSDIDLIVEFSVPVTLLTLSSLKNRLEALTGLEVDVIHGPIQKDDMIEIGEAVELYAA